MNFTREPIIETVITPREGCKLVIRSSKGVGQEDYSVEAVEVISFGHSFFFRSLERPTAFLVPISDYEIVELKETRMSLKNMGGERSIKIGGGRDAPPRPQQPPRESRELEEQPLPREEASEPYSSEQRSKQGRRRSRRRRSGPGPGSGPGFEQRSESQLPSEENVDALAPNSSPSQEAAPSFISKLFPPPPTLIKETLSRYKTSEEGISIEQKPALPEEELFQQPGSDSELSSMEDEETKFED